ncbi:lipocalin family protein [Rufibacter aurantiacus]|uniref:lipocalin family protein n=1 Tax=Rufibacter aurantiacus TaxID=2817374 RepID=UPI001B30189C|nr:lipocalin family protein [Rufibacter aurantiacus]
MKKFYFYLLLLPLIILLESCSKEDDPVHPKAEYVKGSWQETKVRQTVFDETGALLRSEEFGGNKEYELDSENLHATWYSDPLTYHSEQFTYKIKGQDGQLQIQYLNSFSSNVYDIQIVSADEMVWSQKRPHRAQTGLPAGYTFVELSLKRK